MERLLAVWVRELATEGDDGSLARRFLSLLDELVAFCPFVEPVRLGLVVLPLRGPSRFFGGEEAVIAHVVDATRHVVDLTPMVGVGDGVFTAFAAARAGVVVPAGSSDAFRRALPISALECRELATVCRRLGLHTVGAFADLEPARVAERFTRDALSVHRVARGEDGELRGQRDVKLPARLRALRGDEGAGEIQGGFFGDHLGADRRAAAAAHLVRRRLGPEAIRTAALRGGRTPQDRASLIPWGAPSPAAASSAPWPGRIPAPSPSTAFAHPVAVQLCGADATTVRVDARGLLSAAPTAVIFDRGRRREITWFAGPWPSVEQWWIVRRRRAYLQVLTTHEALLLYAEGGSWWLVGIYD